MGQIEEERLGRGRRPTHEVKGCARITLGQLGLNHRIGDHLLVLHELHGAHVIGIEDAQVLIESLTRRQPTRFVAQMSFAHAGSTVTRPAQHLGHGEFRRSKPVIVNAPVRRGIVDDPIAIGIASGQQRGP